MGILFNFIPGMYAAVACGLVVSYTLFYLIRSSIWGILPRRRWIAHPDLPILNLKGNDYAGASKDYFLSLDKYLVEGREKYRHTGFQLWTPEGYLVIVPEEFTEEVKLSRDSVLDSRPLTRSITGDLTWMEIQNTHFVNALRNNLISRLGPIIPSVAQRVREGLVKNLSDTDEWTPINAWDMMSKTIVSASARTFVGDRLGQDPEWQSLALGYTASVISVSRSIRTLPLWKGWLSMFVNRPASYQNWLNYQEKAYEILKPVLEERIAAMASPDFKSPNDGIQWIIDEVAANKDTMTLKRQTEQQLSFIFVSLVTTASAALSAVYDLLSQPEYLEPLRAEIDEVLDGSNDQIDSAVLSKLSKLDSFLKESQRLNGGLTINNLREVHAPEGITFSNGLHLPRGTVFGIPLKLINKDSAHYSDPEAFQGFRYSDIRAANPEEDGKKYFITSTSHSQLTFGHGRHSCPGRYFAVVELKTLFAVLLRNYDLQTLDYRPRGPKFAGDTLANKEVDIFYKRRRRET